MITVSVSDIAASWRNRQGLADVTLAYWSIRRAAFTLLAQGQPVPPGEIAATSGVSEREVRDHLDRLSRFGGVDLDSDGNLTASGGLSLTPTPHRFIVGSRELYAWCSLDTFFLPAYVGDTAQVESQCAVTGDPIRVTIGPDGIESTEPTGTHISVTIPGVAEGSYQDGTFRDRW